MCIYVYMGGYVYRMYVYTVCILYIYIYIYIYIHTYNCVCMHIVHSTHAHYCIILVVNKVQNLALEELCMSIKLTIDC